MTDLDDELDTIFERRDRSDMAPTIAAFEAVRAKHPDHVRVLYEVGGAYDTDGQEQRAAEFYERALAGGLAGDLRRRCLLQYGSTLRNLDRFEESRDVLARAVEEFPDSPSLPVFQALTLHESGRTDEAFALLLEVLVEQAGSPEIQRYGPGLRELVAHLRARERG